MSGEKARKSVTVCSLASLCAEKKPAEHPAVASAEASEYLSRMDDEAGAALRPPAVKLHALAAAAAVAFAIVVAPAQATTTYDGAKLVDAQKIGDNVIDLMMRKNPAQLLGLN